MVGRPDVGEQDVILVVTNHAVKQRHKLGMPLPARAA